MNKALKIVYELIINALLVYLAIHFLEFKSPIPGGEIFIICTITAIAFITKYIFSYINKKCILVKDQ